MINQKRVFPVQGIQKSKMKNYLEHFLPRTVAALTIFIWNFPAEGEEFKCYTDICNVNTKDQFCSAVTRDCWNCADIANDCGSKNQPANCTSYCAKFMVSLELQKIKGRPCDILQQIPNGSHNGSLAEHSQGDVIKYTCHAGFRSVGEQYIQCGDYGKWSSNAPTCKEITCQKPLPFKHGSWKHLPSVKGHYSVGDTVTAVCDENYVIDGTELWNCSLDGSWTSNSDSFSPVCDRTRESSDSKFMSGCVVGALGMLLLGVVACVFKFCIHRKNELRLLEEHSNGTDIANEEDELKKLLDAKTNDSSRERDTVSLRDTKQIRDKREKVASPDPEGSDIPQSNLNVSSFDFVREEPLTSGKDIKSDRGASITVHINNNINNTNMKTGRNILTNGKEDQQPAQGDPPNDNDKSSASSPPEPRPEDKNPVEESGTVQPQQPEPSDDTFVKFSESADCSAAFADPKANSDNDAVNRHNHGIRHPIPQTVDNVQDLGAKIILPNMEINMDDI